MLWERNWSQQEFLDQLGSEPRTWILVRYKAAGPMSKEWHTSYVWQHCVETAAKFQHILSHFLIVELIRKFETINNAWYNRGHLWWRKQSVIHFEWVLLSVMAASVDMATEDLLASTRGLERAERLVQKQSQLSCQLHIPRVMSSFCWSPCSWGSGLGGSTVQPHCLNGFSCYILQHSYSHKQSWK